MDTVKAYGPPGTGKTHTATEWIARQVQEGARPEAVAFVSFTKAACEEARSRLAGRLDLYPWELEYCATIHALCLRQLAVSGRDWLAEGARLKGFAELGGWDLVAKKRHPMTDDLDEISESQGADAPLLEVWNFGRARRIDDPDAAFRAYEEYDPDGGLRIDYRRFLQFVHEYEGWKQASFLKDFTDILIEAVRMGRPLAASVAVVDEAQDMTPLLWAAADVLFAETPIRACLADDDQSIYTFQGASPELFNERPAAAVHQLRQSRRLPRRIAEHAARVIGQNRNRVPKELRPVTPEIIRARADRPEGPATQAELEGSVARIAGLSQVDLHNGQTWMLLCRNWLFVPEVVRWLEDEGIPYRVPGDYYSPWSDKGPLKAARAMYALSVPDGKITGAELAALVDKTRTETKHTPGAWQHGAKARLSRWIEENPGGAVSLLDLAALGLTEWAFERIALRDLGLLQGGISDRDLGAYQAAQRRGTWDQAPRVLVSTIHGVKGQEADNVVALASATRMPVRNLDHPERREEEIRLAYVAITRARQRFFCLEPLDNWGLPYEVFGV